MRLPLTVELHSTAVIREELAWHIQDLAAEQTAAVRGGATPRLDGLGLAGLLTNGPWGPFSFTYNLVVPIESKFQIFEAITGIDLKPTMKPGPQ